MVLFFESTSVDPPALIYMGRDKIENEELLTYGLEKDVWFHVDKLSSAHVYLRLNDAIPSWEQIPESLLQDCAQLVKANSIEGNRKNNLTIIYTPWSNVKKTGDMAIGAVSFHNDRKVKRTFVKERDNTIVNRLNKTRKERQVDHEAERQERLREEGRRKKNQAIEEKRAALAQARAREAEKEARDYTKLFSQEAMEESRRDKERKKKLREALGQEDANSGTESDDSFM
ncbi:DUF814-domain-containing protein [Violaceomyces palustris]|uniref:DUF814-domain-containing protein n=1 Tax=Violaceomyces palustris TaxID=1673888 RepID=A0ACD0NQ60_9BASI|nr:DUF814-domain-containing protein [Violaceomyces palustris]